MTLGAWELTRQEVGPSGQQANSGQGTGRKAKREMEILMELEIQRVSRD